MLEKTGSKDVLFTKRLLQKAERNMMLHWLQLVTDAR